MPSKEVSEYFDATEKRATREDLKLSVKLVTEPKIAIDCGCGAGSDIAYLRSKNFRVHAFDIEPEAIARCQKRFGDDAMYYHRIHSMYLSTLHRHLLWQTQAYVFARRICFIFCLHSPTFETR